MEYITDMLSESGEVTALVTVAYLGPLITTTVDLPPSS